MADFAKIESGLKATFDGTLVDELLAAHRDAKTNFHLGGLRLSAVEGERFCEAAYRLLEQAATKRFTPLGKQLDTEKIATMLLNKNLPDGARIHIPRALRMIYDIRNKRDAAHLGDGIDPNDQDATLVISAIDWVLAELVRLHHGITANEAHRIIVNLVARQAPVVQDFDGFLKILNPKLQVSDRVLVLLYQRGADRATIDELLGWVHPKMRTNLKRTLEQLEHDKAYLHH
jgi:hypothetical protein